jgi:hypothetical protein
MTLRQIHYRLVSVQATDNTSQHYDSLSKCLIRARQNGDIPWEWMEDRLRYPRGVSMWADPAEFLTEAADWYRRDVWVTQPRYLEFWVEKDALSGFFEDELAPYGVTFNVGRGYDSWSSIKELADRLLRYEDCNPLILYFGDFDPSGEDMVVSLEKRLRWFTGEPAWADLRFTIRKMALTRADIGRYNLPPNFTKITDTRRAAFIARHGDIAVELDALPVEVLQQRIRQSVRANMDLAALERTRKRERADRKRLQVLLRP